MVSFTPVQWLQTIISNCMQMISIENDRKLSAINPKDLKKIYESYSEEEKNKIHQLISVCSLSNLFFRFHTTTLTEACSNELKQHHL